MQKLRCEDDVGRLVAAIEEEFCDDIPDCRMSFRATAIAGHLSVMVQCEGVAARTDHRGGKPPSNYTQSRLIMTARSYTQNYTILTDATRSVGHSAHGSVRRGRHLAKDLSLFTCRPLKH